MKSRKVYRPTGAPSYDKGGKTKKYSTKGYKDVQKKGGAGKALTKHFFDFSQLGDIAADLAQVGLNISAYQDWQNAVNEWSDQIQDPETIITGEGGTQDAIEAITEAGGAPTPSQNLLTLANEIKGQSTDVEIDDSAITEQRETGEQTTADLMNLSSKSGTKGMANLSNVLKEAQNRDLALGTQQIDIAKTEEQLETQQEQSQLQAIKDLTTTYGGQEFAGSQDIFGAYTGDLESAAQLQTALMSAELGGAGQIQQILANALAKDGMKTPKYEEGGQNEEVMEEGEGEESMPAGEADVSPGEEEHATNPIDLVKDGKKIGEMTGGEVIMPSKDVEVLEQLLSKGDAENIMKLMGMLMMKWNKKAQEYAEKEIGGVEEARGGMRTYKPSSKINY